MSWLEKPDGLCPFCHRAFYIQDGRTVILPKQKSNYNLPVIVRLSLSLNRLETLYKEKSIKNWESESCGDLNIVDTQLQKIKYVMEKIRNKIDRLIQYSDKNGIDVLTIFHFSGKNQ